MQSVENLLGIKENERNMLEMELNNKMKELFSHLPIMGLEPHTAALSEIQRKLLPEITELLRRYSRNDKELAKILEEFKEAKSTCDSLNEKITDRGGQAVVQHDSEAVKTEYCKTDGKNDGRTAWKSVSDFYKRILSLYGKRNWNSRKCH